MWTRLLTAVLLGIGFVPVFHASIGIPQFEYLKRRQSLRQNLDGVLVLFGRTSTQEEQLRDGFFQEPYFNYLTGWQQTDAIIILSKTDEMIFLPPRDEKYERYYGHNTSPTDEDATRVTGFEKVLPRTDFESELLRSAASHPIVYTIPAEPEAASAKSIFALRRNVEFRDATARLDALREVKSPQEIQAIQRSADVSIDAHLAAFRRMKPGLFEYQIAATLENAWRERACERAAYAPIVASGLNSVVLHYSSDKRKIKDGDLVVMDAAAECLSYAADITRTIPANGRFTPAQRAIYDVVLAAQRAAIRAVKPGAIIGRKDTPGSLMNIAFEYINTHGTDRNGDVLGKYVLHGLSHHIGLDVHDPGDIMKPLQPGMVISIEPGVYIKDENIGIRIEDMVLVTPSGCEVLTRALPKDAESIEKLMRAAN